MKTNIFLNIFSGLLVILAFDGSAFATKHRISVADFQFSPKTIPNIKIGDTIRWYWFSGMHTTTSDTIPTGATSWDHPIDISDTVFEYVPILLGTYKYKCTPHLSLGMIGSFTVISTAGISNKYQEPDFSIYPNPVFSNLSIHIESQDSYIKDLRIFDLGGRLVGDINFVTSIGVEDKTINLSDLPIGIYLLEFIDNHNNHYIHKVTKL